MRLKRYHVLAFVFFAVTASAFAAEAPITLIVPFSSGGPTDALGRALAESMSATLERKVVVKNVVGAGGTVGSSQVAKAKPDGNTLLLMNIGHATGLSLYPRLPYHPVNDFEPIGLVADVPMTVIAKREVAAANLKELVTGLPTKKRRVAYGDAGVGSASHLCGLLLMNALKTDFAVVSYRGMADAMDDLLVSGRFDFLCDQTTHTLGHIKAGEVKALGVTTKSRLPELPNVPTLNESGLPGFELLIWHGLYAPKGTPTAVLKTLEAALQKAVADPKLKAKFADLGALPATPAQARPEALRATLKAEIEKWGSIIREAGAHAD